MEIRERIWKKVKVNGPGRWKLGQERISWQKEKRAWLYSDLLQVLKDICQLWVLKRYQKKFD